MNTHKNQWVDNLISKNILNEVPENIKNSMEEQISLFYKQKRKTKEGFCERIFRLYLSPQILTFAKNGLLTIGLMAGIMILAGVSTATVSSELSANSFIGMKLDLSLMTSLSDVEEVNAEVFIKSQNGEKRKFKTIWKADKWISPIPETENKQLEDLLSPYNLKQVLDSRLKFSNNKKIVTFYLINSSIFTSCKIILNKDNFLPAIMDGLINETDEEFTIIYNWKTRNIVSITNRYFIRRKK